MSYGVTDKGWVTKPFQAILDRMVERAKEEWGEDIPTSPETVMGQVFNIVTATAKDNWDMGQGVADMQVRSRAEGYYLDYLADLAGITRLKASGSTGDLLFYGEENTLIPQFTACKDVRNFNVLTDTALTLNRSNCYSSRFSLVSVVDNQDYIINVEGVECKVNSAIASTELSILSSLKTTVESLTEMSAIVDEQGLILTILYPSYNNNLTTTNSSNITLESIGSLVSAESAITGTEVNFGTNQITTLVSTILGVSSVTNPLPFQNGREVETDAELRIRMQDRREATGSATKPALESSLRQIDGVSSALVVVNDELYEVDGIPAKSFECFVSGGTEEFIAETIWNDKSLMGKSHGSITKTIVDGNGDTQAVKFSRPTSDLAWVRVTYEINDEESFPADGEARMRASVVSTGNSLQQGEDLEPTKFYGGLYTVSGIYVKRIQVAVTSSPEESPVYSDIRIPVGQVESLLFSEDRVSITT